MQQLLVQLGTKLRSTIQPSLPPLLPKPSSLLPQLSTKCNKSYIFPLTLTTSTLLSYSYQNCINTTQNNNNNNPPSPSPSLLSSSSSSSSSSSPSSSSSSIFSTLLSKLPIAYSGQISGAFPHNYGAFSEFRYGGLRHDMFLEYPVIQIHKLTPTRYVYFFQLPDDNGELLLPASTYVVARYIDPQTKEKHHAAYFPLFDGVMGEFALLGDHDPNGTDLFKTIWPKIGLGDSVELLGPFYTDFSYRPHTFDEIIMLAGGPDGIGPMMQVYRTIYSNPNDHTRVHIIYCNKNADKALFVEHLNRPRNTRSLKQFVITYLLEQNNGADDFKKGFIENTHYGRLTKYKLNRLIGTREQSVVQHNEKRKILVSGPPGFMRDICGVKNEDGSQGELTGWLKELGYKDYEVTKI